MGFQISDFKFQMLLSEIWNLKSFEIPLLLIIIGTKKSAKLRGDVESKAFLCFFSLFSLKKHFILRGVEKLVTNKIQRFKMEMKDVLSFSKKNVVLEMKNEMQRGLFALFSYFCKKLRCNDSINS